MGSYSKKNETEINNVVALLQFLVKIKYEQTNITVLTYLGQSNEIAERLKNVSLNSLKVTTVDKYQGKQNEIIILSLVRSKKLGHLIDRRRMCVALSRAKNALFCIGNFDFLEKDSLWAEILIEARKKKFLSDDLPLACEHSCIKAKKVDDFKLRPEGGCEWYCTFELKCKHKCKSLCHIYSHDFIRCQYQCGKKVELENGKACGHAGECNQCEVLINKTVAGLHTRLRTIA